MDKKEGIIWSEESERLAEKQAEIDALVTALDMLKDKYMAVQYPMMWLHDVVKIDPEVEQADRLTNKHKHKAQSIKGNDMKRYSREDICNLPELNCGYVSYNDHKAQIDELKADFIRLHTMATKWVDKDHHDWQEILRIK